MSESTDAYDLIIIGGGPPGVVGARIATAAKKKTAVIDCYHELGGAGLNTGTIPSKTLRETALALSGLRSRDLYGVDLSLRREVTVRDFLGHERHVKAVFNANFLRRLRNPRTGVLFGKAAFIDAHTVSVEPLAGLLGNREKTWAPNFVRWPPIFHPDCWLSLGYSLVETTSSTLSDCAGSRLLARRGM